MAREDASKSRQMIMSAVNISDQDIEKFREIIKSAAEGMVELRKTAGTGEHGADTVTDWFLVGLDANVERSLRTIEQLRAQRADAKIAVLSQAKDATLVIECMRRGAVEFIDLQHQEGEAKKFLERAIKDRFAASTPGKVFTFYSPKGGVGVSFLAVNFAIALRALSKKEVILLDGNIEIGDVATMLDIEPEYTVSDLMRDVTRIDQSLISNVLTEHANTGIKVLCSPTNPEDATMFELSAFPDIINGMRSLADYVVIDTAKHFDEATICALDAADSLFIVSDLSIPTLKKVRTAADLFERLGYQQDKIQLLINRMQPKDKDKLSDFEKALNLKITETIAVGDKKVQASIDSGVPLFHAYPEHPISVTLQALASCHCVASDDDKKGKSFWGGLFK